MRSLPLYSILDYAGPGSLAGVHVHRFEDGSHWFPNRMERHRHDFFQVFWLEGSGEHFNDFKSFPVRSPSLVFIPAGQVHGWTRFTELRGLMMAFTYAFIDGRHPPPSDFLQFPFWFSQKTSPVLEVPRNQVPEFKTILKEIEREFARQREGYQDALRWLLRVLFVRTHRLQKTCAVTLTTANAVVVTRDFRLALENRFRTVQSVTAYAQALKLSAARLNILVQAQTGFSPGELIRQRVLLEAQRLLVHSELSVSEIAFELSFEDPSYFSRSFRRQTGRSPKEFRASFQTQ